MIGPHWTLTLALILAACHDPPPRPPGRATPDQVSPADPHRAQYVHLVGERHRAGTKIAEAEVHRIGSWRFFQEVQDPPMAMKFFSARAAVDGRGRAVAPRLAGDPAWHALLTTDGLEAVGALERVAWLFEAAPVSRSGDHAPIEDPAARMRIADPVLERTAAGVRFVGWFARPPTFEPWRTTIDAPAAGPAKVTEEMLRAE